MSYREASSCSVRIQGARGDIFTHIYLPEGDYPAPAVVICHGIPGNERLMDFAVYLREQGFAAIHFHYGGSWGSHGDYSMLHCMEDVRTVLDWVKNDDRGLFDLSNIFVLGHSMGGLMASMAIATLSLVKGGVVIMPLNSYPDALALKDGIEPEGQKEFYDGCGEWLSGFDWEVMKKELLEDPAAFDLAGYGAAMAKKPVLTVAGSRDTLLPRENHLDLLIAAIEKEGCGKHKALTFDTDHAMNFQRSSVREAIGAFLKENTEK